jgi:hypothetical protein
MPQPQYTEWLIRALAFIGGAASTVVGSWISSKIRLYHDDQKSHHQELKQKILLPLREVLVEYEALFKHQVPVIGEKWAHLGTRPARPDQDESVYGALLESGDPWPAAFSALDRALLEDAKRVHYKSLMAEISGLSSSWKAHTESCLTWVSRIGTEVLDVSKMNPYQPPYNPPYVNHLRLAVWVYLRLFHLPRNTLHQSNQGQYWAIEGAPTVPAQVGISTMAKEEQNAALIESIDRITAANRERAAALQNESRAIVNRADNLRSKLEYEMAKKKLRKRCDLVRFF